MHIEAAERLLTRAIAGGGRRKSIRWIEWDIGARCQSPVFVPTWTRPDAWTPEAGYSTRVYSPVERPTGRSGELPVGVDLFTPCRACEACLKARARLWRQRAGIELGRSPRSWFGTMTLSADNHSRIANFIRVKLDHGGTDFDGLPPDEQYAERHGAISRELTLWLKRVRKESGARLRYCLVAEAHKSGLPHYHILIHELDGSVKKRQLQSQWELGFTNFKVVRDPAAGAYLTKYLSKSALARVRASLRYGEDESAFSQSLAGARGG